MGVFLSETFANFTLGIEWKGERECGAAIVQRSQMRIFN